MPTFTYTSLGASVGGAIEASDRSAALRELIGRGVTPASLVEVAGTRPRNAAEKDLSAARARSAEISGDGATARPGASTSSDANRAALASAPAPRRGFRSAMSLSETAAFISELATALQAGLPLIPALRTLGKSGRTPAQQAMLAHLIARVEQGGTLADAARTWGKPFNELIVNLIRAGEASGRMGEVLQQTAELVEKDLRLRRSLLSATLYPLILVVLSTAAIIIVTTFIVPTVLKPFEGQKITLPFPTLVVQQFARIMGAYWWLVLGSACLLVLGYSRLRAAPASRLAIDKIYLKIPLMGALIRDASVARFTRTLGTLVRAGLPVLTALRLTSATLSNLAMRRAMDQVCEEVAGGKTISGPLEKTGLFPPLLVQIVNLGERSGKLPELLHQAANSLESRTETRVKVVTTVLPPVLVVILACVVGFVVMAILLALLEMQDMAGKL
ncbi:type II secretion system F family protein [soil metagenome]